MKRLNRKKIAKMWCEMNAHRVPKELTELSWPKVNKKKPRPMFNADKDMWGAMVMIEAILGKEEVLKAWREYVKEAR